MRSRYAALVQVDAGETRTDEAAAGYGESPQITSIHVYRKGGPLKITVTIDEPTDDFRAELLALLSRHATHVEIDIEWTPERAERYYRTLPPRARRIVRKAVANSGTVSANELRDTENASLRGHSAPLRHALDRGVRKGWWPAGMTPPIEPQGPGFGKVRGYRLHENLLSHFAAAVNAVEGGTAGHGYEATTPAGVDERTPVYFFCNSCGEEVQDENADCCDDGEIEPSYDEPFTRD